LRWLFWRNNGSQLRRTISIQPQEKITREARFRAISSKPSLGIDFWAKQLPQQFFLSISFLQEPKF
jgi:hypothetical protein